MAVHHLPCCGGRVLRPQDIHELTPPDSRPPAEREESEDGLLPDGPQGHRDSVAPRLQRAQQSEPEAPGGHILGRGPLQERSPGIALQLGQGLQL
jgi:hypothetical protein